MKLKISPVGRCPMERITTPNSANVIDPSSSLSNSMKTSLNSTNGNEEKLKRCFYRHGRDLTTIVLG